MRKGESGEGGARGIPPGTMSTPKRKILMRELKHLRVTLIRLILTERRLRVSEWGSLSVLNFDKKSVAIAIAKKIAAQLCPNDSQAARPTSCACASDCKTREMARSNAKN